MAERRKQLSKTPAQRFEETVEPLVQDRIENENLKKRINQKTEVAPAIIAFAKLLDRQMPGALNPARVQQVLRGLRELG